MVNKYSCKTLGKINYTVRSCQFSFDFSSSISILNFTQSFKILFDYKKLLQFQVIVNLYTSLCGLMKELQY